MRTDWLYTKELKADQITTGIFNATNLTVIGLEVGGKVTMGKDATIDWSNVTGDKNGSITKITENTIKTSKIVADFIDARKISADNITTGVLDVSNKGDYRLELSSDGIIGYSKGDQQHGIKIDNRNLGYAMVYQGTTIANLYFDTKGEGTTEEARRRVFLQTQGGIPLKIKSGSGISFEANGTIYFASDVKFKQNSTIDFAGATVTGLSALDAVAKFG